MNEMNIEPVDLGDELRQCVQAGLDLAPVVLRRPVARELLHRGKLYALGGVGALLALGPLGCVDALAQITQIRLGSAEGERAYRSALISFACRGGGAGGEKTDCTCGSRSSQHNAA